MKIYYSKKPFICFALIGLLAVACQPASQPEPSAAIASSANQIAGKEETIIKVQYNPLQHTPQQIQKIAVPENVLKSIPLSNGKLLIFADKEQLVYGYQADAGNFYKVGFIGSPVYLNEITSGEAIVFGKSLIWVKGLAGASTMITDIIEVGKETVFPFLHLEKDILIVDVDQNEEKELLTLAGNPFPKFTVIKLGENGLVELDINQALQAEQGIRYNPQSGSFTVSSPGIETKTYRLESTGFHLNQN